MIRLDSRDHPAPMVHDQEPGRCEDQQQNHYGNHYDRWEIRILRPLKGSTARSWVHVGWDAAIEAQGISVLRNSHNSFRTKWSCLAARSASRSGRLSGERGVLCSCRDGQSR